MTLAGIAGWAQGDRFHDPVVARYGKVDAVVPDPLGWVLWVRYDEPGWHGYPEMAVVGLPHGAHNRLMKTKR